MEIQPFFVGQILSPIEVYLADAQSRYAVDASSARIEPIADDWDDRLQYRPCYTIRDLEGSSHESAADGTNSLAVGHQGTLGTIHAGAPSSVVHQIRFRSAAPTSAEAARIRDYALAVFCHGITTNELKFSGFSYSGQLQIFQAGASVYASSYKAWVAAGIIHLSLKRHELCS